MVISQQQIHVIRLNLKAALTVVAVVQLCLSVFVSKCLHVCVCVRERERGNAWTLG